MAILLSVNVFIANLYKICIGVYSKLSIDQEVEIIHLRDDDVFTMCVILYFYVIFTKVVRWHMKSTLQDNKFSSGDVI